MPDQPKPVADISLIAPQPGDNRYFVVFSSRDYTPAVPASGGLIPSTPGHAFVSWGIWDQMKSVCTYESYGLYNVGTPAAAIGQALIPFFGPVPGEIQDESLNGLQSVGSTIESLVVETGQGYYMNSHALMDQMSQEPQPYVLGSNDCVTFVQSIADDLNLNVPPRGLDNTMPVPYIHSLKQAATEVQHEAYWTGPTAYEEPAGYGTWKDPNSGWTWVGTMAGDTHTMVGVGLYTAANGMITHGARDANGLATGPCYVSNAPDGTTCTSNFVGGYPNGITTLTWPNGNSAQVLMVNGVIPTSSATFTFANGDKYTGPMQNGELNGGGWYTWADGTKAIVSYANGVPQGILNQPNGVPAAPPAPIQPSNPINWNQQPDNPLGWIIPGAE